tara:strand:+ start:152 stop:352 length:201 start_codon:yes stop_codon:yes gene_type:complete
MLYSHRLRPKYKYYAMEELFTAHQLAVASFRLPPTKTPRGQRKNLEAAAPQYAPSSGVWGCPAVGE